MPAALLLAGCGLLPAPGGGIPIDELDLEPRELRGSLAEVPTGPHMEVLSGEIEGDELSVVVQRDAGGMCIANWHGGGGGSSCGPLPGAEGPLGTAFGLVMTGSQPPADEGAERPMEVVGVVSPDVTAVVFETDDGAEVTAHLVPLDAAGIDARLFIAYLPIGSVGSAISARADDGTELGRLVLDAP